MKGYELLLLLNLGVLADELKDPTAPGWTPNTGEILGVEQAPARELELNAIFLSRPKRAIINGNSFALGEKVNNFLLIDIGPWYVRLRQGKDTFTLWLKGHEVDASPTQ